MKKKMWTFGRIAEHYKITDQAVRKMACENKWSINDIDGLRNVLNYYYNKNNK